MTAELSVYNQLGVALAADSAVTTNGNKVFNTATKIFTLDSDHFVGIMIYGNADYMNIPWEVIIKTFREQCGQKVLDSLELYEKKFIDYIQKFRIRKGLELNNLNSTYNEILQAVIDRFDKDHFIMQDVSDEELNDKFQKTLSDIEENQSYRTIKGLSEEYAEKEFAGELHSIIKKDLTNRINENGINKITKLSIKLFFSNTPLNNSTGIVIAGYGDKDIFPKVIKFSIDGSLCGKIKVAEREIERGDETAKIIPFAQQEMVHTILKGIDPTLETYRQNIHYDIKKKIKRCLSTDEFNEKIDNIFQDANQMFEDKISNEHISPVVTMLSNLSLSELGTMAETFVSLTSFKRKYSGDIETVGGPVDVLVISRSDGPIWIKRKKYFDIDMNEGFVNRRRK